MPIPEWPSSLPSAALSAYQEQVPNLITRQTMDVGPAKVRKRVTAGVRQIKVKLNLSKDQAETLDEFYLVILQGGSIPFTWVLPRTGEPMTCRIIEPFTYTIPEGFKDVIQTELSLEALP